MNFTISAILAAAGRVFRRPNPPSPAKAAETSTSTDPWSELPWWPKSKPGLVEVRDLGKQIVLNNEGRFSAYVTKFTIRTKKGLRESASVVDERLLACCDFPLSVRCAEDMIHIRGILETLGVRL